MLVSGKNVFQEQIESFKNSNFDIMVSILSKSSILAKSWKMAGIKLY